MNYISLNIAFSDAMQAEILTAELADYPFESFEADAGTLKAYIPQEQLADCKGEVDALLARYGVQGRRYRNAELERRLGEQFSARRRRGAPVDPCAFP